MPDNEPTGEIQLFHNFPRILYVSFYLSQGNNETQLYLLEEYLQDYPFLRPTEKTHELFVSECTNFFLERPHILQGVHHKTSLGDVMEDSTESNGDVMEDSSNLKKPLTEEQKAIVRVGVYDVLDWLVRSRDELKGISDLGRSFAIVGMLMKDKKTLNAIEERNKKDIKLPTSYYLTYCLNKQITGIAAFDRAFEKMYLDIQEAKNDQNSPLYPCIDTFLLTVKESSGILTQAEKQALIDSLEKSPID